MIQLLEIRGAQPEAVTVLEESDNLRDFARLYARRDELTRQSDPCPMTARRFAVRASVEESA